MSQVKGPAPGTLLFVFLTPSPPPLQVEEIVETGELDPDHIHIPSVFVNRIYKAESMEKRIEVGTSL